MYDNDALNALVAVAEEVARFSVWTAPRSRSNPVDTLLDAIYSAARSSHHGVGSGVGLADRL